MLDPQARALIDLMNERGVPPVQTLSPTEARALYRDRRGFTQPEPPAVVAHVVVDEPPQLRPVLLVQAGDVVEVLAPRVQEGLARLLGDLLQRFQAVGGEAGADHVHPLGAGLRQRGDTGGEDPERARHGTHSRKRGIKRQGMQKNGPGPAKYVD